MRARVIVMLGVSIAAIAVGASAQQALPDAVEGLAQDLSDQLASRAGGRVAILPFKNLDGSSTLLGAYLAEELTTAVLMTPGVSLVERSLLDQALDELKLQESAAIDPQTAQRLGEIAGASAIVTGTLTDLGSSVAINLRLIDTGTGEIVAGARGRVVQDDSVKKLLETSVAVPAGRPESPAPAGRHGGETTNHIRPSTTVHGVKFTVRECRRNSADGITCEIEVLNQLNKMIGLYALGGLGITSDGTQTKIDGASFMGYKARSTTFKVGDRQFPADVPTVARISLAPVPAAPGLTILQDWEFYVDESYYKSEKEKVTIRGIEVLSE